jgi:hypothetical protein
VGVREDHPPIGAILLECLDNAGLGCSPIDWLSFSIKAMLTRWKLVDEIDNWMLFHRVFSSISGFYGSGFRGSGFRD